MQDNKLIKALVLNAQLGNNSAFEQLYQMTVQQIFALILRLTGSAQAAKDLTKKTYLNAWKKISEKSESLSFAGWLKKIAAETAAASRNSNSSAAKVETAAEADQTAEDFFGQNSIEGIIRNLEYEDRLIFVLHDIENMPNEQITEISGLPLDEVKSRLIRTRENLIILSEE